MVRRFSPAGTETNAATCPAPTRSPRNCAESSSVAWARSRCSASPLSASARSMCGGTKQQRIVGVRRRYYSGAMRLKPAVLLLLVALPAFAQTRAIVSTDVAIGLEGGFRPGWCDADDAWAVAMAWKSLNVRAIAITYGNNYM